MSKKPFLREASHKCLQNQNNLKNAKESKNSKTNKQMIFSTNILRVTENYCKI